MPACDFLGPSLATEWNAWQDRRTGWAALAWIPIYYEREEDAEIKPPAPNIRAHRDIIWVTTIF